MNRYDDTTRVIEEIDAERRQQVDKHCWSAKHDDKQCHGELARAAAAYALESTAYDGDSEQARALWPFSNFWWRPRPAARENLVKAAALIVAEIERIDRTNRDDS